MPHSSPQATLVVFGASGPTGQIVTRRALERGHAVTAVTRRPAAFPLQHPDLQVVQADLSDPASVDRVVDGATAVIATFGVPYSRRPISVYSEGMANILLAMDGRGVRRLVCVTSKEVVRELAAGEPLVHRLVVDRLLRLAGRSLYADMRRMEAQVRSSTVDWTIVRPAGLFDGGRVTPYRVTSGHEPGVFTSRDDLADLLIRQAVGEQPRLRQAVEVLTDDGTPSFLGLVRREAWGR